MPETRLFLKCARPFLFMCSLTVAAAGPAFSRSARAFISLIPGCVPPFVPVTTGTDEVLPSDCAIAGAAIVTTRAETITSIHGKGCRFPYANDSVDAGDWQGEAQNA
jgi:hypothetical protein